VHGRVADIGEQFTVSGNTITGDDGEAVYLIHDWDADAEAYDVEGTAKPESSLSASQMDMPPVDEADTKAGLLDRVKSVLGFDTAGSDDDGTSSEALDAAAKADAGDATAPESGTTEDDTMSKDDPEEPPAWAADLTEKVEQIEKRIDDVEEDDDGAEKALDDAPEWANELAEKVDGLDERVDTIATQSGGSQQLGKSAEENGEATEKSGFTLDPRKSGGR